MSADDLSASGRWARDPYVQALEEQLKKLGFKVYTPASYVFSSRGDGVHAVGPSRRRGLASAW